MKSNFTGFIAERPISIEKAQEFIKNYLQNTGRAKPLSFLIPKWEIMELLNSDFSVNQFPLSPPEEDPDHANFIRLFIGHRPNPLVANDFLHILVMVGIYAEYQGVVGGYDDITLNSPSFIYEQESANGIIYHHYKVKKTFEEPNTGGKIMAFDWSLPCPPFGCDANSTLESTRP